MRRGDRHEPAGVHGEDAPGRAAGHIPDLGKLKEPENLRALKPRSQRRWGIIDLLDFLKESDFVTAFTGEFTSVATREATPREVIRSGCCWFCSRSGRMSGSNGSLTAAGMARPRPRCAPSATCSSTATTCARRHDPGQRHLADRDPLWWGNGTACASDSKKFGSWSST